MDKKGCAPRDIERVNLRGSRLGASLAFHPQNCRNRNVCAFGGAFSQRNVFSTPNDSLDNLSQRVFWIAI